MAACSLKLLGAKDYVERAKSPKYLEIILQEHLDIINTPISGNCDHFQLPANKKKNRYPDFPSWDISRVVIRSNNGLDYINANYINGFDTRCKFIATQEPMETTFDDFWNMIWQDNANIIVMLNGISQKSQPPVSPQYFSVDQDHTILKEFIIREESIKMETHYIHTALTICRRSTGESRIIHHFKYLNWPENGVPDVKLFLDFLLTVNKQDQHYFTQALLTHKFLPGPIVVHGNAGIGRTTAYCVADMCLYQLIHRASVSVPFTVLNVRRQRRSSIQTPNYYVFINNLILYFLMAIKVNPAVLFEFRSHLGITDAQLLSN
uniref:Protein tyrosine phosphatase n=1 Tax=Glyptapanteles indiensis TaxID=92994 RepID=B7S8T6_GLYIN|nr:protein tyrosine phosphatase [Glyptapanteles indiensis]